MRGLQALGNRPYNRIVHSESTQLREHENSRMRVLCVAVFFSLCFAALGLRLIEVGLVGGGDYPFKRLVSEPQLLLQSEEDVDVSKAPVANIARRDIVDRNGLMLATSVETASLVANPAIIRHERDVAALLHAVFPDMSQEALYHKLMRKRSTFMYLRRNLTPAQQEQVNNLGVPGLFFESATRRVYPYSGLFSHVLGYVGIDNNGLSGLEKQLDSALKEEWDNTPIALSLDLRLQAMLRDELASTVEEFRAIGATAMMMDITTGEILAMVNLPEFDPQHPTALPEEDRFNRATLGAYEMGSVFKTFTTASALEHGVTDLMGMYDARSPIRISRFTIDDTHPLNRFMSVPEVFAYSSNIGTVKMALDVGTERLQETLKSLGLFAPVPLELPERSHPLIPKDWKPINTMTISFGHGMSVSPLHVMRAYATIANGGREVPLTLRKRDGAPVESRQVLGEKVSQEMVQLMRLVVTHGTAKSANAKGYNVGGKTGTAEKVTGGRYKKDAKLASFVGVFPTQAPRYAILVMVDEPKGNKSTYGYATGGWISAPVVKRFIERAAASLALMPAEDTHDAENELIWKASETKALNYQKPAAESPIHAVAY